MQKGPDFDPDHPGMSEEELRKQAQDRIWGEWETDQEPEEEGGG